VLTWIGVALFGACGAVARFRVDGAVSARLPGDFPAGTLVVNLTGSFALGVLVGASASHRLAFLLGTGFMGGYTTFSTWMVESERLGEDGELAALVANLALSLLAGLAVAAAGFYVGRALA
jgi:fluoride exporter